VRAARPELTRDQVTQVLRLSAQDLERPGWDPATGFGEVSVGAALQRTPPRNDPLEPNDDIEWIDGRALGRADPPVFKGRGTRRLAGGIDAYEDPNDVYRVTVLAHSRVRVVATPRFGAPDLAGYPRSAKAL